MTGTKERSSPTSTISAANSLMIVGYLRNSNNLEESDIVIYHIIITIDEE